MDQPVLTFGEAMLRLTPPAGLLVSQASNFDAWVAGSESNVACGLANLGVAATWIGRLPDHAIGHKVETAMASCGVDVDHIVWTSADDRVGTFYAEQGASPRSPRVIYDRKGSAATGMSPADISDSEIDSHRWLHMSGITPALSESCTETAVDVLARAKKRGMGVSFDVNYRAKLWTSEAAHAALMPLVQGVDTLFCSSKDAQIVFGCVGSSEDQARSLAQQTKAGTVIVTDGARGASACVGTEAMSYPAIPVETTLDRFGSGDAFAAGYLWASLREGDLGQCLQAGCAAGALKRTIRGDILLASASDLESVMRNSQVGWR